MNWMKTLNLQVKLALPIVPMLSDYFLTTSSTSMTEEERANIAGMRASWKALAQVKPVMLFTLCYYILTPFNATICLFSQDLETQWDSPLLFPDKAPKTLLADLPPTVVFSAEFDMFITGSLSPQNAPHFSDFVLNPQKLNALWVNCEEQARWLTSVVCQVKL